MRLIALMSAAFVLFVSGPAFAQEWIEYISEKDLFSVNFPAEPEVRDITYPTEYGVTLPGRVYVHQKGLNRFSMTVVDYEKVQQIHADRLDNCKAYPNTCANPYQNELRGAIDWALWGFLKRDAKLTDYAYYNADRVEGRRLQILNPDGTRTFAAIHMHQNRLYVLEGTVAPGAPPPGLFQQSLAFVDKAGNRVRYESVYSNAFPAPGLQLELSPLEGRDRE
jgi:hypothetical protein